MAARNRAWSASTRAAAQGQHAVRGSPVGVGEQRVVANARGKGALGHAAQEHTVEVEAEAQRDVPHEDAVAEPTHAAEVVVELEGEGAAEHVEAGRPFDRVEPREALQGGIDLVGGLLLGLGPRLALACSPSRHGAGDVFAQETVRPRDELTPRCTRGCAACEIALQRAHESLQPPCRVELVLEPRRAGLTVGYCEFLGELPLEALRVTFELLVPPRAAADDPDLTADPLPSCCGRESSVGVDRCRCEQRHHVVTVEVTIGKREQCEQRTTEHALGQRAHCRTVVWDTGRAELLVDQARVRLVGAEQDGHAIERDAVTHRVDDHADDGTNFVVGVRHRHDARRPRDVGAGCGIVDGHAEPRERVAHARIRARDAGHPSDDDDRQVGRRGVEHARRRPARCRAGGRRRSRRGRRGPVCRARSP